MSGVVGMKRLPKPSQETDTIKVDSAFLHQALQASGIPAERTINGIKMPGLKMVKSGDTLYIQCVVGGKPRITAVPMTNVANWNPTDDLSELFE